MIKNQPAKRMKNMKNKFQCLGFIFLSAQLLPLAAAAQEAAAGPAADPSYSNFYARLLANGLVLLTAMVMLGVLFALLRLLSIMVKLQQLRIYEEAGLEPFLEAVKQPRENWWSRLYARMTRVAPLEKEKDILFDHEYDGIRELDNSLPPWWVWMFYITIAFSVAYMTYYHFAGIGPGSEERYEQEMEKAEQAVQAYLARQANQIDETNVTALSDEQQLALGKTIYEVNCLVCHGALGEGGVGPNLTDEYWIHGGSIADVFRVIKNGVPEKGMIPWKSQLRPQDMQRVASYILTLQGTNPPNAKQPEGERHQVRTERDTTKVEVIGMEF
jgi:cytochrome c oxidase cbb3-type subunit 3